MQSSKAESKPLALLIPGLDGTGQFYYLQLKALKYRYRPLPWAYAPGAGFSMDDLILALGRATALDERGSIRVVGESFGGLVALHYVLRFPERVAQLVLINAFPCYRRKTRVRLAFWLAPLLGIGLCRRVKESTVEFVLKREGIPADVRRRCRLILKGVDPAAYCRRLQLLLTEDLRPRLHEILVPTVLLASGRDKLVPSIREARFMASRIRDARVHEFPMAGHGLLLTPGVVLADYV